MRAPLRIGILGAPRIADEGIVGPARTNALVNSLHARWNVAALQAGKDVLSEKPLTGNAEQAHAVRAAACYRRAGLSPRASQRERVSRAVRGGSRTR